MSAERTIRLLADGVQPPGERTHVRTIDRCRGCGQQILWCKTAKNHKAIPFDDLELSGSLSDDGEIETVGADTVHWGTCPKADQFR
jgi:hypothetical protein